MGNFSSTTKTPFHRKPKGKSRLRTALILTGCALAALIFFTRPLSSLVSYIGKPIHVTATWFTDSTGTIPSYVRSTRALIQERDALKEEVESQKDDHARVGQLEGDNTALRELIGGEKTSRIVAGVIVRPDQTPYDTLLIDRGTDHGVAEGAVVFAHKDVAIGYVARAWSGSALVTLFSTPGVKSVVYVFGPDTFAVAEGQGGGILRVGVPQGVPLAIGDTVILPTIDSGVFGRIEHIEADEANPEQYGFVAALPDISGLRFVAVDTSVRPQISYEEALTVIANAPPFFSTSTLESFVATGTQQATTSIE